MAQTSRFARSLRPIGIGLIPLALAACGQQAPAPAPVVPTTPPASSANPTATLPPVVSTVPPASTLPSAATSAFRDGTYEANGSYVSPGGPESIDVKLSLEGGRVTSVTVTPLATRPISLKMQNVVASNVSALVVGKPIDQVQLDKVSGSSLTPQGFNDAVQKIKQQATAS